jgi:hypothetical protein
MDGGETTEDGWLEEEHKNMPIFGRRDFKIGHGHGVL